ncbi:hypothetical protein EUX98_g852 [Antrodiella citrinella]|uniref:Uncharacterized protein n=1 Tax=Antrodiella citrinella TaxID=2447956 RepID=A0A4S4N305_9APHY|nr:hypothetical protein EUX98_g852 [Antrodiella citrinella]
MGDRPATSKSRGICHYYTTPRGCFAGKNCKFSHGETEKFTPYDKAKVCKFFAAGYCKRGSDCWFVHNAPNKKRSSASGSKAPPAADEDEEEHVCCICMEKPVTYGLLAGCSHIYCIQCIRNWRDRSNKSYEMISSGNTKKCPLCRALSPFVTPSSHFYPDGDPGKEATITQYKSSMSRVACRYFEKSPKSDRFCPFGKDCFYQHLNADGSPYLFDRGVSYYIKQAKRHAQVNDHDEDGSPWLHELSTALEAIRASVPNYLRQHQDNPDEEHGEDWIVDASEDEVGSPAYVRAQEALTQLPYPSHSVMARIALSEPGSPTHGFNFFRTLNNLAHLRLSPQLQSTDSLPLIAHSTNTNGPRFSTVVHGRFPDYVVGPAWDLVRFGAQPESPIILDHPDQLSPSAPSSSDLERLILLHPPAELDEPNLHVSAPALSVDDVAPPVVGPPSPDSDWDVPTSVSEPDPPLLTDGRGRVVWSTTPASRRGRGRAGSAAVPSVQQHKPRLREESAGSERPEVIASPPRGPTLTRARSFPETSSETSGRSPSNHSLLLDGPD